MSRKIMKQGFDHPCRDTCSGWRQGYERGIMEREEVGVKLHSTMDAVVWANEFCKITKLTDLDQDTMRAWFANSIMCGWDHAHQRMNKDHTQVLNFCAGLISTMDQFKDKHPEEVRDWILKEVQAINDKDAEYEREQQQSNQP